MTTQTKPENQIQSELDQQAEEVRKQAAQLYRSIVHQMASNLEPKINASEVKGLLETIELTMSDLKADVEAVREHDRLLSEYDPDAGKKWQKEGLKFNQKIEAAKQRVQELKARQVEAAARYSSYGHRVPGRLRELRRNQRLWDSDQIPTD